MTDRQRQSASGIHLPGLDPAATPLLGLGLGLAGILLGVRPRLAPLPLAIAGAVATLLYRNPQRTTPGTADAVFAPADGIVCGVEELYEHRFLHTDAMCISILSAPFDIPIQRSPASGIIAYLEEITPHTPFVWDLRRTTPEQSPRLYIGITTDWGPMAIAVFAGTLTHQVSCAVAIGDQIAAGDRVGMARFGARTDLLLPRDMVVGVPLVGEHVRAGESALGQVVPF